MALTIAKLQRRVKRFWKKNKIFQKFYAASSNRKRPYPTAARVPPRSALLNATSIVDFV
jgi:hypothetical protein